MKHFCLFVIFVAYCCLSMAAEIKFDIYYKANFYKRLMQAIAFILFAWFIWLLYLISPILKSLADQMRNIFQLKGQEE